MTKPYSEMAYAEKQKACKELRLSAAGTGEDLLARLEGAGGTAAEKPEETETETPEAPKDPEAPAAPAAPAAAPEAPKPKVSDQEVKKELKGDAAKMKAHLAKQKKISILIPFEVGIAPEQAEKIPFVVNMNGYRLSIKRGVYVDVPEQVANMIKERLQSERQIGRDKRIDRDERTQEALG